MIKLTEEQKQKMYRHAENTYPEECCGILLGRYPTEKETLVVEVWETENAWEEESKTFESVCPEANDSTLSKRNRFTIAPAMLLKAQKYARTEDLNLVGIYHSHPDHSCEPSVFDEAIAWETYSYVIMSVRAGTVVDCCSWKLIDGEKMEKEEIIVTEGCH